MLVTDIAMPEQDGYMLLRRVRALETAVRRVPAIAVTAHARADDRALALKADFQEYVPKPIESARLIRAVRELALHTRSPQLEAVCLGHHDVDTEMVDLARGGIGLEELTRAGDVGQHVANVCHQLPHPGSC